MPVASNTITRRRVVRQKVASPAIFVTEGNTMSFDCVIRDVSEMGAKLAIPPDRQIPELFLVIDMRTRMAYRSKLIWQTKGEIGVEYRKPALVAVRFSYLVKYENQHWRFFASAGRFSMTARCGQSARLPHSC